MLSKWELPAICGQIIKSLEGINYLSSQLRAKELTPITLASTGVCLKGVWISDPQDQNIASKAA